jgi:hypothetical protein
MPSAFHWSEKIGSLYRITYSSCEGGRKVYSCGLESVCTMLHSFYINYDVHKKERGAEIA